MPGIGTVSTTRPPSNHEPEIGLSRYLSTTPGIGGRLKLTPDAFRVDEVSRYPCPAAQGRYTIARFESFEIEQNELLHRLSREFGLPDGRIGFAGTKDRRAVTTQLLSLPVDEARVRNVLLSGVRVLDTYRSNDDLHLGHLFGNCFGIRVQSLAVDHDEAERRVRAIEQELRGAGGFPNYYGPQRFGEVRPVTHLVGRALVLGSVAEAVDAYLTIHAEGELEDGTQARRDFASHRDPVRGLREFPRTLRFERILLERLARGDSPERAFHALPRHLRTLFVHAYQSYLFNRYLSLRIERGFPMARPIDGDWLIRLGHDGLSGPLAPVQVSRDNLAEAETMVRSLRGRIAAPVVGADTPASSGEAGDLMEEILQQDGATRKSFALSTLPEMTSSGTFRAVLGCLPLHFYRPPSPVRADGSADFFFPLEKGEYATVLLREFMKN